MTTFADQRTGRAWSAADSDALYGVSAWGQGYFEISPEGRLLVTPRREAPESDPQRDAAIDLHALVQRLRGQGLHTPLLFRFRDIVEHRVRRLGAAFERAIEEAGYGARHRLVYPIKVNQQRAVVEGMRDAGRGLGYGLEVGSKPELLAVLGLTAEAPETPIICNGFKDEEFIEAILLAAKLGRDITVVIEKVSEAPLVIRHAQKHGVRPRVGVRAKLAASGAGRWQASGGMRSKFGLFMSELLEVLRLFKSADMADCLRMVHCHIGSQVCAIRNLKHAISEVAHIHCELRRLGAAMDTIDVGGGLGVDYDGSRSARESSMNYTVEEYASDIVHRIRSVCDEAGAPHPEIITESGRAMAAHASVLVFDVIGVSRFEGDAEGPVDLEAEMRDAGVGEDEEIPQPILDLRGAFETFAEDRLVESFHDALQARDDLMTLFSLGAASLPMRGVGERLFWGLGRRIMRAVDAMDGPPEELLSLPEMLSDIYFCNFSLFQSMPDSWAIDQIFPICPIQRLDERPTRRGVLADVTCDSDGEVSRFASTGDLRGALELHQVGHDERYYVAAFLVGAYQEILGDLHNLFGDTHAVHVGIDEQGRPEIEQVFEGDTVADVLRYVQIDAAALRKAIVREAKAARARKALTPEEASLLVRFYTAGLEGYTYLEENPLVASGEESDPLLADRHDAAAPPDLRTARATSNGETS